MPIERDSLSTLQKKITQNYMATFKPLENTTKHNILKTLANVDAGIYHLLLGDMEFLSKQLFPDTATGEYLRSHWSDKVAPLYGQQAIGNIIITGKPQIRIPAGCVFSSTAGNKYYTTENYKINENGEVLARVLASDTGTEYNLAKDSVLTLSSNLIAGMESEAKVVLIAGGSDGESDEEYLSRVLNYLQISNRYGRVGDFAAWAIDSSSEVVKGFEFKNFGAFGALLIVVVGGNFENGFTKVYNIAAIKDYIDKVAPPIIYTVRSVDIVEISPTISLSEKEDTIENRNFITQTLKLFFANAGHPNMIIYQAFLQNLINDGEYVNTAKLTLPNDRMSLVQNSTGMSGVLPNSEIKLTQLEYPVLGVIIWE